MQLRTDLPKGLLPGLLLLALPLQAMPFGGDDSYSKNKERDGACEACQFKQGSVADVVEGYMQGTLPASFCADMPAYEIAQVQEVPEAFYAELIAGREDAQALIGALLERYQAKSTKTADRTRILDLAASLKGMIDPEAVAAMWSSDRRAFSMDHMIALAKGAPEALIGAIEKAAQKEVLPAAFLALKGDQRGIKVLRRAVKRMDLKQGASEAALAAFALSSIGDKSALETVRRGFEEATLAALDEGDLDHARELALQAQFLCKELVRGGKRSGLERLDARTAWYVRQHAGEVVDAEAIFTLTEGLRS